jgi:hypothetical protein
MLVMGALAMVGVVWRLNLILNHPEKEERLRQYQERKKGERQEMYQKAAPVIEVAAKLLVRMLTKK